MTSVEVARLFDRRHRGRAEQRMAEQLEALLGPHGDHHVLREGLDASTGEDAIAESTWQATLQKTPKRVVLTDGADPRVVAAAVGLAANRAVQPVLLAETLEVARVAEETGGELTGSLEVLAPDDALEIRSIREALEDAPQDRSLPLDVLREHQRDPLYLGAAALRYGYADACVGGSTRPTAEVVKAAISILGLSSDARWVTSSFLMVLEDGRALSFGDCAVLPQPDSEQLAEVALATSATFRALTGEAPRVALLSFSTKGSAHHPQVTLVRDAVSIAARRLPTLCLDGELQADAALDMRVGERKSPGSLVAGHANVLVFPNLDAGNIGYKLTQRLAHARAMGPLLQGLSAPMNDLSRGCSTADIRAVTLASALMALGPE